MLSLPKAGKDVVEKWSGILDADFYTKRGRYIVNEKVARLPKVMIPKIRRTFPQLIASELLSVQPMSGPYISKRGRYLRKLSF